MNWKLKANVLAVLSRVPGGASVYHGLQRLLGTNRLDVEESLAQVLEIPEMIREAGGDPCRGCYLEVGTGWRPFLPFVLSLIGAERILTFDINPWLNYAYALETYRALGSQLEMIAQRLSLPLPRLQERYRAAADATDLAGLLRAFRVEYRCPADAAQTGLADASVDFVVSSNVLEHVPPDVIRRIHREAFRVLRPNGLAVHRFNPGDHSSLADPSVTAVNFLRYSPRQWHWWGGSGLGYHNRLRCPQHRRLLEEADFAVVTDRVRVDAPSLEGLSDGRLAVHPDFRDFSAEELAADYMWLVGMRPPGFPRPPAGGATRVPARVEGG